MSSMPLSHVRSHICWSCQGMVSDAVAFCPTCTIIQPPIPDLDFFQIFEFSKVFPLDTHILEQRYQRLQKQFHPDRFATRGSKERRFSLEHVIRLNKAYQTLKDSHFRSEYLLEMLGHDYPDLGKNVKADPEFLMEVMELREALDSIDLAAGAAAERLEQLRQQIEGHLAREQEDITQLFARFGESSAAGLLVQIAQANDRSRYHRRFLEALDLAEETLYGGHDF